MIREGPDGEGVNILAPVVSADSISRQQASSYITALDLSLRTAVRRGMTRPKSKSPVLITRLSVDRLLKRFFPPLLDGNEREAGRICSADMRSGA